MSCMPSRRMICISNFKLQKIATSNFENYIRLYNAFIHTHTHTHIYIYKIYRGHS